MPATYTIDEARGLVITSASGTVTVDEAFTHQQSLAADPKFRPEFNQILDTTGVTEFRLSVDEIRAIARRTIFAPKVRRAIVVKGALSHGLGRMLAAFREIAGGEEEIQIFHDREQALSWLAERRVAADSAQT